MKQLSSILFSLLIMSSCSQEHPKNYLSIEGTIENSKDSVITISNRQGIIKQINIDKNGVFKDTLALKNNDGQIYSFSTNTNKTAPIYLKNGYDIYLKGDSNKFMESFIFSGKGASNSNFVLAQIKKNQSIGDPQQILNLDEINFNKKIKNLKKEYDSILSSYSDLDSTFYEAMKNQNKQLITFFETNYQANRIIGIGKPSPTFENYLDINGDKKSLSDFKGKYVYVDVWATWCGPCIQQIPYLKSIEKEYHNKNIEFISISTDESSRSGGSWEAAEKKWKNFVKKRNLSGVQLWSGKDYSFQQAYQINGIPRFILIDPEGKIVDPNAPRPSDPSLKELLNSLL